MNQTNSYNRHPLAYLAPQIVAHIALIYALFTFEFKDWLLVLVGYTLFLGMGVSVTWHRIQTHRAALVPEWLRHLGCIFGCLALQGTQLGWVAKHLQHHRHSDSVRDPHSPQHNSAWKLYWSNLLISSNLEMRYVALALKDPLNLFYHKWHFIINGAYAVILWAIDPKLLLSLWLVPAALAWFMTGWGVAVWSHQRGSIRYQLPSPDHSRNNHIVGILGFGEGYQNNHHHTPYKPRHSQGKWEFDPLGRILELVSKPKI